jgi:curved DNA-binding protein CbpA
MGQLEHQQAIKKFDPYEILGINENATESEIKSAWKNLTMEWHPDKSKNADSAEALAKIIMINRAYHALTDEDGKKNYQKYGNPDGPGSFNVYYLIRFILIYLDWNWNASFSLERRKSYSDINSFLSIHSSHATFQCPVLVFRN